jgi:hypothetical protein
MDYVAGVMRERFHTDDLTLISDRAYPRGRNGEEFSDLELLRDTLDARINTLRNKRGCALPLHTEVVKVKPSGHRHTVSGWTIHDLHQAAGVKCPQWCSKCYPRKRAVVKVPAEVGA